MRKIIALVLTVTAIVVLFTSCKDNGDDTTQESLSTSDTSATTESTTTTAPSTTGATYVLTTNQNKQAPWYTTTRFIASPGSTTTSSQNITGSSVPNMYEDITYPTNNGGAITPSVSAVTSAAKTTVWSTLASDGTTKGDDEDSTKGTTAAVKAEGKQAVINSTWFDGDGNFCAAIDNDGWGKIKSNSMRIPIYIDGVEAEKPGTLQISSSVDGDGNQYVFVNVSKYDVLEFGGSVSFTIPEGFLKNSSGTRYNYETEVSM